MTKYVIDGWPVNHLELIEDDIFEQIIVREENYSGSNSYGSYLAMAREFAFRLATAVVQPDHRAAILNSEFGSTPPDYEEMIDWASFKLDQKIESLV